MSMKRAVLLSFSSVFLLTGCGEGYELIKTNTMFPYGNQRTAGSGVAYVLAKMLPKKELKLEPVKAETEAVTKAVTRDWKPAVMDLLPEEKAVEPVKAVPKTAGDQLFLDDGKK